MVSRSRSSSFLDRRQHEDSVDGFVGHRRLGRISRSADGRFVLSRTDSRSSSLSSSSDDGGFLSHPSFVNVRGTSSRRPLIRPAAAVSATSGGDSVRTDDGPAAAVTVDNRRRPIVVSTVYGRRPSDYNDPTTSQSFFQQQQQQHHQHRRRVFDPSSSVVPPTGPAPVDRTLRIVHEQYSQQLPSLRVIHEENQRTLMQQQHQLQQPGPRYHPNPRFRSRHMRYARSAPELASATAAAAAAAINERSPESRSSSSGFGSKNTSSLLQQTTAVAAAADDDDDWYPRTTVPPYKPPPPPPPPPSLFYANEHWLDYTSPILPSPSSHSSASKPLSVDDQYEFDPIFPVSPTPTADIVAMTRTPTTPSPSRSRTPTQLKKAKYENVEARLQAMKEEFYAYKRRQAEMARMGYVESAC